MKGKYSFKSHYYILLNRFKDTISLNASVLGSVVLASRLNFVPCVFAFISLSLIWFALYPIWRRMIRQVSRNMFIFWTVVSSSTCVILLSLLSLSLGIMYLFLFTITTTFISPAYLLHLQKYKNEIHGPWDEAKPLRNVRQL